MRTLKTESKKSALAFGALLATAALGVWACAFKDDTAGTGGGLSIFVTDSSKVSLAFDDPDQTVFEDSGEFNLDEVRKNIHDKGIDLKTVAITTLNVTYDDSTKKFLSDNKGLPYNLKIYIKAKGDTAAPKLALVSAGAAPGDTTLTLDPNQVMFGMGKELAVDAEGFPFFLSSIQDTIPTMFVLARLTVLEKLKATGKLNLNMVVTVGGKP